MGLREVVNELLREGLQAHQARPAARPYFGPTFESALH